jgi:hypothetical protein
LVARNAAVVWCRGRGWIATNEFRSQCPNCGNPAIFQFLATFGPRNAGSAVRNYFRVRFYAVMTAPHATLVPFVMPLKGWVFASTSDPALSTGPGTSVEIAAGPRHVGGREMRRGQRRADAFQTLSISDTITKQACRPVVGWLLDTFDKDEGDVSVLQHQAQCASCVLLRATTCARSIRLLSPGFSRLSGHPRGWP